MSYYDSLLKYKDLPFEKLFRELPPQEVDRAIHSDAQDPARLLALLAPAAEEFLDRLAAFIGFLHRFHRIFGLSGFIKPQLLLRRDIFRRRRSVQTHILIAVFKIFLHI